MERYDSEGGDAEDRAELMKERADAWKSATGLRRKHVNFCHPRSFQERELQVEFEKSTLHAWDGKAGETHRLFLLSADLLHEGETTPWCKPVTWRPDVHSAAAKFLLKQTGLADILMFLDGRSRDCRKQLETETANMRHASEIWVVYKPSARLGRKVSWASDNKEVILVSTPVPRTQLPVKPRSAMGASAGESTTHDASYTGVPTMPWGAMAILSSEDKARILGHTVQKPREQLFGVSMGQPLFWGERKSVAFWRGLFHDFSIGAVVDASPGSGTAARAALEEGVPYLGLARNNSHSTWLSNVTDRAVLRAICTIGSPVFNQDLATSITQHFQDILDAIAEADNSEDNPPDGDVDPTLTD